MANRFLNNITVNDSYTFPPNDGSADQVIKTDGAGNLSFTDVVAGEADKALSLTLRVKNTESVSLTKGQVVCAAPTATPPSGNVIEVKLADNDGTDSMPAIGILNEGLDAAGGANDEGEAIMFGRISGIDTSAFSVGDEVFVSDTPGGLTTTKPTGIKYIQKVGVVMRDDATNGTIEVFGAGRTNDVPTPLYIDHANQRVGIGETLPDYTLDVDGSVGVAEYIYHKGDNNTYLRFSGDQIRVVSGGVEMIRLEETTQDAVVVNEGGADVDFRVESDANTHALFVEGSSGNVGIGTTSPSSRLEIRATDATHQLVSINRPNSDTAALYIGNDSASPANGVISSNNSDLIFGRDQSSTLTEHMRIKRDGNVGIGTTSPQQKLQVASPSSTSVVLGASYLSTNNNNFFEVGILANDGYLNLRNSGVQTTVHIDSDGNSFFNGGNVGIGATSPSTTLQVYNSTEGQYMEIGAGDGGGRSLVFTSSNNNGSAGALHTINAKSINGVIALSTAGSEAMRITSSGNVGIGTPSPGYKLEVAGEGKVLSKFRVGGAVMLAEPGTGLLQFGSEGGSQTAIYSASQERIRINSSGNVGIGTTSPDAKLHVNGNIRIPNAGKIVFGTAGSPSDYLELNDVVSSGKLLKLVQDGATRFDINGVNGNVYMQGNVGIGETNPGQKLDVAGNIKMTETAATTDTDKIVVSDSGVLKYRTGAQILSDIGGQPSISAPNAPTNLSLTIVGNTVDVTFTASTTSDIDAYLIYSSVDGSDYGLISIIPPDDFSATMSIIDDAFSVSGTQAYRVYAMKLGNMSSALTGSISYTVSTPLEPTNMSVVPLNTAYFVQWDPPSSNARFVTAYNVYKHEDSSQANLARASATLVYSGMNTNYMYQISGANNTNYHQFWVETTVA